MKMTMEGGQDIMSYNKITNEDAGEQKRTQIQDLLTVHDGRCGDSESERYVVQKYFKNFHFQYHVGVVGMTFKTFR